MNDLAVMNEFDALAQLIEPLDNLGKIEGLGALLTDASFKVALAAELHQNAQFTIQHCFFD